MPSRIARLIASGVLGGGGVVDPTASWPLKINDAFTDTNATLLENHTIAPTNTPGNAWTRVIGTAGHNIVISSNKAAGVGFTDSYYVLNTGAADVAMEGMFRFGQTGDSLGFILRFLNSNNYFRIQIVGGATNQFQIWERQASSNTVRANAAFTPQTGVDYTIRVTAVGSVITATINGSNSITYTTAFNATQVNHGLYYNDTAGSLDTCDDFKVFF